MAITSAGSTAAPMETRGFDGELAPNMRSDRVVPLDASFTNGVNCRPLSFTLLPTFVCSITWRSLFHPEGCRSLQVFVTTPSTAASTTA